LTITSNAPSSPDRIAVSGFGYGAFAMQTNTKSILLGNVNIGAMKDTTFTIFNIGYDTVKVGSIFASRPQFTVKTNAKFIAPGQSITDTIHFAPISSGADSGFIIIQSNSVSSPDTIKVNGVAISPTGIMSTMGLPTIFSLSQNYPNPFNPSTVIEYGLPKDSQVRIIVFDILGRQIKTLVNEEKAGGRYNVEFSANSLSSGMYFYQMRAGLFVETKKLILLK
ncbi:MAG: choice-of-anchor D domain-containing protein, partial [Bacteroidota bacterium]